MNWEIFGATGEWIGAVAVLATLLYLARQIRQQNELARFNAYDATWLHFDQTNLMHAENGEVAELFVKGWNDPTSLNPVEKGRWHAFLRAYWNNMYRAFQAHRAGFLPDDDWNQLATNFAADVASAGGADFRANHDHLFPHFWAEIDRHFVTATSATVAGFIDQPSDRDPAQPGG